MTADFTIRLSLHLVTLLIVIRWLYYPRFGNREFTFSIFMLGNVVFVATYWLKDVSMTMGFAFGLFAIFSILRYRTETLPMTQMTFLFIGIGIALINAAIPLSWTGLLFLNGLLLGLPAFSLSAWFLPREGHQTIIYDRIEWIVPHRQADLMADLKTRTGLDITRIEVESIDFLHDIATLNVYFR